MKIEQSKTQYKEVLELFNDVANLEVVWENTGMELIRHKPTGWYFFTCSDGTIINLHNENNTVAKSGTLQFFLQLFTRPNIKIQRNIIKYRNEH